MKLLRLSAALAALLFVRTSYAQEVVNTAPEENYYIVGIELLRSQNFSDAILAFNKDIELNPGHSNAYYSRGVCYHKINDIQHACADWQKTFELGDSTVSELLATYCQHIDTLKIPTPENIQAKESRMADFAVRRNLMKDSVSKVLTFRKFEVYMFGSVLVPVGAYATAYKINSTDDAEESIKNTMEGKVGGFGASQGYALEAGFNSYFNNKTVKNAGGLHFSFISFTINPFRWEMNGSGDTYIVNEATYKTLYTLSIKAGPCIRTIVLKDLVVRGYYSLCPTLGLHAQWNYSNPDPQVYVTYIDGYKYRFTFTNDEAEFKMNEGTGLKHEFGLQLSYKKLLVGVCFNFGNIKYNSVEFSRSSDVKIEEFTYSSQTYHYYGSDRTTENHKFSAKAPTNFLLFSFGVRF